jgi:hypothetical protein
MAVEGFSGVVATEMARVGHYSYLSILSIASVDVIDGRQMPLLQVSH